MLVQETYTYLFMDLFLPAAQLYINFSSVHPFPPFAMHLVTKIIMKSQFVVFVEKPLMLDKTLFNVPLR